MPDGSPGEKSNHSPRNEMARRVKKFTGSLGQKTIQCGIPGAVSRPWLLSSALLGRKPLAKRGCYQRDDLAVFEVGRKRSGDRRPRLFHHGFGQDHRYFLKHHRLGKSELRPGAFSPPPAILHATLYISSDKKTTRTLIGVRVVFGITLVQRPSKPRRGRTATSGIFVA